MHREAWRAGIHGVEKSRTQLSDWTELNWTEKSLESEEQRKGVVGNSMAPVMCCVQLWGEGW